MRVIADLGAAAVAKELRGPGIPIRMGDLVVRLRSSIEAVAHGVATLYADYPVADHDGFADFHVRIAQPRNGRRWLRPQVLFEFDGFVPFKPLPFTQAFALLEWGLNWCVHRHLHRQLIIHAAVVERYGRASILSGAPGAGKSTLCAALVNRGWRLLSDELALVSLKDLSLAPLPRPVSLKEDSIEIIRAFAPDAFIGRACVDTNKGRVAHMRPPKSSVERAGEAAAPAWIMFPRYTAKAPVTLTTLSRGQAAMRLAGHAFNYNTLGLSGFQALCDLTERCQTAEFEYSDLDDAVSFLDELPDESGSAA